ncbi:uncharacterized protein K452DRAFT_359604 [Aplosporella prunicola CBS 121167]|uniref:Uncharacterized protein n=1 Tax=Aplosporella prunicola CBS 121167 TaxID=1176127 RepID=A0A6A6BDK8_9PEZI|nr:uncharacterized protein K452DRAFT_359604 [Aplosporella prunicola CBS 121167]KAF2140551.1 hypothetical protein K452DRAFT_359604 [Aplosporella prunicola CBS 121167]
MSRAVSPLSQTLHPSSAATGAFQPRDDVSEPDGFPSRHPSRDNVSAQLLAENGTPSENTTDQEKQQAAPRITLFRRVGKYSLTILVLGLTLLIAAIIFLIFLWWEKHSNTFWKWIVLKDRATIAVTLAALVIQLSITAQASVAMSMLASLALERWSVPIGQSMTISTMRFTNTGPLASLLAFSQNIKNAGGAIIFLLTLLLAITTIGSQFTSTILLLDVPPGTVMGLTKSSNVSMGLTDYHLTQKFTGENYWASTPPGYQAFAEASVPPDNHTEEIVDTGPTIRALLPFASEATRGSLQSYSGETTIYDARVACVRPKFTNTTLFWNSEGWVRFAGTMTWSTPIPDVINPTENIEFDCEGQNQGNYTHVVCPIRGMGLSSYVDKHRSGTNKEDLSPGRLHMVLAYNSAQTFNFTRNTGNTSVNHGWITSQSLYLPIYNSPSTDGWDTTEDGPWLKLRPTRWIPLDGISSPQPAINATICYDALSMSSNIEVKISSPSNRTEPVLRYNQSASRFIVDDVALQVGATKNKRSLTDRGILSLDLAAVNEFASKINSSSYPAYSIPTFIQGVVTDGNFVGDYIFCMDCYFSGNFDHQQLSTAVNGVQAAIFQDILKETNDPSLALQAQLTNLVRMIYYDALTMFSHNTTAITTTFETHVYPKYRRGIIAIFVNIGAHIAFMTTVIALFATCTRYSLLDNAWAALAQISTRATEGLLRTATLKSDDQVQAQLKENGRSREAVRIQLIDGGAGRVGVVS